MNEDAEFRSPTADAGGAVKTTQQRLAALSSAELADLVLKRRKDRTAAMVMLTEERLTNDRGTAALIGDLLDLE